MHRRDVRIRLALTLLVAAVVAGCGTSDNPIATGAVAATGAATTSGTAPNASSGTVGTSLDGCEVITAADAEAVLGVSVIRSDEGTVPQQEVASCVWDGGAGTGTMALVNKLLQLHVYDGTMFFAPDQYKEMQGFEPIDGIGDDAFAYGTGSFDLTILAGDRTITIGASGFTPDDRARVRQAVLDLASTVLDRL